MLRAWRMCDLPGSKAAHIVAHIFCWKPNTDMAQITLYVDAETERMVKHELVPPKTGSAAKTASTDTRHLENELAEKLGTRVAMKSNRKGQGTLTIHFHSLEHLDGILERSRLK